MRFGPMGLIIIAVCCIILLFCLSFAWNLRKQQKSKSPTIAFIHPDCDGNGGGERVLWSFVECVQELFPEYKIIIFTKPSLNVKKLRSNLQTLFAPNFNFDNILFAKIWTSTVTKSSNFPFLTILLQAISQFVCGLEIIFRGYRPSLIIDTQGLPFLYPLLYLWKISTIAYVHYPILPTSFTKIDFLRRLYMNFLSKWYSYAGSCLHDFVSNSAWTQKRLQCYWPKRTKIIYPPCEICDLALLDINNPRETVIMSLSQFRPEKNHKDQIDIVNMVLKRNPQWKESLKFFIVGGCRNENDRSRAKNLNEYVKKLDLNNNISVIQDMDKPSLTDLLSKSLIAIHTMKMEHFGISIVEFMASGVIPIAHRSGGPLEDIILSEEHGFLCESIDEYCTKIEDIIAMPESSKLALRRKTRDYAVHNFDTQTFKHRLRGLLSEILCRS